MDSSFLNRIILWWLNPLFLLGYRQDLKINNLFELSEGKKSVYLTRKWEQLWLPVFENKFGKYFRIKNILRTHSEQNEKASKNYQLEPPSIIWLLFLMFKYELLTATGVKIFSDILQFAGPFLLSELLTFISISNITIWKGVGLAVALFVCSQLRSLLLNYYFYLMFRTSIKVQSTLTTAIYRKVLKLSNSAKKNRTIGEIINLMAIDVERFQMIIPHIQQLWSCPFQITLVILYLFYILGSSIISVVVIMILFIPLNIYGSIIVKRWQVKQMDLKDQRAKMCSEVLNAIKIIKLFAWEPPMARKIENIRKNELKYVQKFGFARAIVTALAFAVFTLTSKKNILTPQVAFVSLTLFNLLRSPITMIGLLIQQMVQAVVANKRLKEFLIADELDPKSIERLPAEGSFIEDTTIKKSVEINLAVPVGEIIAIVGRVGSGKSSFLYSLLGEMDKLSGRAILKGKIAYVQQQPWIRNLSLRENIIFGRKFDQILYDEVIEACALNKDIAMLPNGDFTEIGEKGVNLSGGQKARVSLARAIYQNCDVYLLDDPLSAVDSHVGKHIYDRVIGPSGLLRNKTRILVTHNLTHLKTINKIFNYINFRSSSLSVNPISKSTLFSVICFSLSIIALMLSGVRASRNLHSPLLHNILRSPMLFFDTTPIGRILNRFGKDIDVIDLLLPLNFRYLMMCVVNILSTFILIIISTRLFIIVIIPLRIFVPTSRQLKRLESVHRSPIYTHFGETIQGSASIRAFNQVDRFCEISQDYVDTYIRVRYLNLISFTWLAIRLELIGNCVIFFASLFAVIAQDWGVAITAGTAGLSISCSLNVTEALNFAVRQISELESNIVAVERVKEYTETSTEAEWRIPNCIKEKGWPNHGCIEFRNYSTRYRPDLDLVIEKMNIKIHPAEKVGIVGRTGAGKSSLTLALFRMIEPTEGQILIDQLDIADLGLHDLRSNLTIIPQEPVLFSGTLRFNLDPFEEYDDNQIWQALHLSHLKSFTDELTNGLNFMLIEGGENMSVGQRQLVCLARALLRKSKVLILDEATAAVDLVTDNLIQDAIRREFKSSTILTIAHRLNTIMDYDRVMVLEEGRIKEFDAPQVLLSDHSSIFYSMALDAKLVE
ncbi:unnamed protein product [Dracunculus medinensis]|uniref:Uncharacterized protein n=1 Tax=Dracunculus medinensis TaxID=318479 RepID=A0A3P7PW37_DRAME|nr:unnamed protein product [Dracunculus medinensis]